MTSEALLKQQLDYEAIIKEFKAETSRPDEQYAQKEIDDLKQQVKLLMYAMKKNNGFDIQ